MRHVFAILLGLCGTPWFGEVSLRPVFAADPVPAEAIRIMRGLEQERSGVKPFQVAGRLKRLDAAGGQQVAFVAECEGLHYRVASGGGLRSVAICDGEQILFYDGMGSAVVTSRERRSASCLAFDPRSVGIATGLFSDLTLTESVAYRLGKEVALSRSDAALGESDVVAIELTDRFGQQIRFNVEPNSPYRVHRYSKTIPRTEGDGTFTRYVTESEFRPDDDGWLPRRLVMYTEPDGDPSRRVDDAVVEFEKPEFVAGFEADTWTLRSLSLPVGQPLADLRIGQRIGYWDGEALVESVPPRR